MSATDGPWFTRVPVRVQGALFAALIVLSGALAYSNSFRGPFVFDDVDSIPGNPSIRGWAAALSPPSVGTSVGARPVANLTLALDYAIGGLRVAPYHATNLLIHLAAGLALFGLVRRTLESPVLGGRYERDAAKLAGAVALLWTLHPLQTESVTYVIQRVESLMGLFFLLTLYGLARSAGSRRPFAWLILSFLACLAGMATKEVMATAPVLALLYDRAFIAGSLREALRRRRLYYLALAATWIPLGLLVASGSWSRGGSSGFGLGVSAGSYWLAQCGAIARYLRLSLWPSPLVFDYGSVLLREPGTSALYAIGILPLAATGLLLAWRRPALGFLGAWFFLILAPSSFVPVAVQVAAEHRMYLSLAAVMAALVIGGHALLPRRLWLPVGLAAAALGFATWVRNADYRSEIALWSDTVAKEPTNEYAHCALGTALSTAPGRLAEAISEYEAALAIRPRYAMAENQLGVALRRVSGRSREGLEHLQSAVRIDGSIALIHYNLGIALAEASRLDEAMAEFNAALSINPNYAEARNDLGVALCASGRTAEGIAQIQAALSATPGLALGHFNLGKAWEQTGRIPEAMAEYQKALSIQPDLPEAENNLALILFGKGRVSEAIARLKAAISRHPEDLRAHYSLGIVLLRLGRREDAASEFETILASVPSDPAARRMLELARSAR